MTALTFSMQGENIVSMLMASVMCLQFSMHEEDIAQGVHYSLKSRITCMHAP